MLSWWSLKRERISDKILSWLLVIILLGIWQLLVLSGLVRPVLLPPPFEVLEALCQLIISGKLVLHLGASLFRVVLGFGIAAVLGISLGLLLGLSSRCHSMLNGILQFFRPIPPIAWLPLAVLWFGIGEGSKVFIIVLGSFFPIFTNVLHGVWQIDKKYLEVAEMFQLSRAKRLQKLVLPAVLPYLLSGCRSGLGYAWMCILAAELTSGLLGIGYLLVDARALAQTDCVMAGMLVIGLVGKLMDGLLLKLLMARRRNRYGKRELSGAAACQEVFLFK